MGTDSTALVLCIVFPILAVLSVLARFYARQVKKTPYAADDWVILPALLFAVGNAANVLYGAIHANLGQHMPLDRAGFAAMGPKLTALEKMAYASEPIVTVAICLARYSILLFYARIFTNRTFRMPVYIMYTVNGLWGVGFTLTYLVQCVPPKELWEAQQVKRQHCIGISVNYYYAVSTIILDVVILAMPWPMVWRLQVAIKQKIAVLGIFMLGAIVVATSIGKCYAFFTVGALISKNHDFTYDEAPLFYWTVPECCLSIVCACLPLLRPIFHGVSPESLLGSIRSVLSLRSCGSTGSSDSNTRRIKNSQEASESTVGFRQITDGPTLGAPPTLENKVEPGRAEQMELQDLERGGKVIRVHSEFQLDEERMGL